MSSGRAQESVRDFLARSGQVGSDLLRVDWAATPLGPIEGWPQSLSTVVRMLLTSRFAMWMAWGPELTFLCNDAYRRDTLGRKYPWALGRPAAEVWAEIWPEIGPRIENVMRSGQATWDEALMLILERSGYREETYHTFSYSPLADDDGAVAGMLCVVSEESARVIGERRMATLRELGGVSSGMREEREFLTDVAAVLGANPYSLPFTLVYLFDSSGDARLQSASGAVPGHPVAPQTIPAGAADGPWRLAEMAADRTTHLRLPADRYRDLPMGVWEEPPVEALVVPIPQPARADPYGYLIVGLNRYTPLDSDYGAFIELIAQHLSAGLAAARTYEAERRRAAELEELDRAKTAFFSNVSHEFRTPLTLMLGPLEDALSSGVELADERLELVHRNALRLLKLVNTLLEFSRAEAGRLQAAFRPTDIGRLTEELASTFREATERAGIDLVVACTAPSEPVYVDRDMWERIVLNLVSNAFKATLEGEIRVELAAVDGQVELAVSDTGTGIPPDEIGRLFQRFHRVRTIARSYEGTGIGLALVKELTEVHGGQVGVQSTLGEGSRFTVRIPTGTAHLPAEQVREESLEPSASIASLFVEEALSWVDTAADGAGHEGVEELERGEVAAHGEAGQRPRVLVADDNPDLRRYLSSLLSTQFDVEVVADGEAALASARERPPDLVISDVMMPGLDGYELLDRLRATPQTQDLPVILLSARAGEEEAIRGLEAGADDYLPKPFSGRELLARVRAHVELSAVRRETAAEVRSERSLLEQTLQQLPVGVMLAEAPSRRVVLANRQSDEILGHGILPHEEGEFDSYALFTLDGKRLARDEGPLARAMRFGQVVEDQEMLYRTGTGRMIILRISAAPIHGEDGSVAAGVLVFQDVSHRVRSERLLAAQSDVLERIAAGEPLESALAALAVWVEDLSEYSARAAVALVSWDRRRVLHAVGPHLPSEYHHALEGADVGVLGGAVPHTAFTGERVVVRDVLDDARTARFREMAARHDLRSVWTTPVRADDGELVAVFGVYYDEPREPTAEDRRVVELLARTAGVAIGRARDAEIRARRLEELQRSLLPRGLPEVPGLDVAVRFHPAERGLDVGGDFYDLFSLRDGGWGFVIGDVTGHGAEAAAVTALTRHTTRVTARLHPRPSYVLAAVNHELRVSDHERYCTALYGRLDAVPGGMRVTVASGGHPGPLVRRRGGQVEVLRAHGPLLGVYEDAEFPEEVVDLGPEDTLVLYTDGLIERNPRVDGDSGLERLVGRLASADADELVEELDRRALGSPPERLADDAAVLVLQVRGPARGVAGLGLRSAAA